MAHIPDPHAQFEYTKMQLIGSLGAVAETMRNCATIAEQFAQLINPIPYHPAVMMPNGPMQHMPSAPTMDVSGGKRKSRDDGEEKKKRKVKEKDPGAPKRPPSSYLFFQNEVRQEVKAKNPNIPNNELLGMIAKAWSEMTKEQKDEYESRQRVAKDQYLVNKAAYEATKRKPEDGEEEVVLPTKPIVVAPVEPIVVPVASSEGESSEEQSDSDSSDEDDEDDDEEPAPKKAKPATPPPPPPKVVMKKSKKSGKTKA